MQKRDLSSASQSLANADSLARAAFTWVRQQAMEQRFRGMPVTAAEEAELAAGFLAGIRSALGTTDGESILVAYSYALMRGERTSALRLARELISHSPGMAASCSGFLYGLSAARNILTESNQCFCEETSAATETAKTIN